MFGLLLLTLLIAPQESAQASESSPAITVLEVGSARVELFGGEAPSSYRVELPGGRRSRLRPTSTVIPLSAGAFDPLLAEPDWSATPLPPGPGLHLVQYVTQPLSPFADQLRSRGIRTVRFIGGGAVVVAAEPHALEGLTELPFVRWTGVYHALHKLEPELLGILAAGTLEPARYRLQVLDRGPVMKAAVARRIEHLGGTIDAEIPEGFLLDATLNPDQLVETLAWPEVFYVDRWHAPQTYMTKVREDGGANELEATTGLTGQGVRGEVLDWAFAPGHPDLQSPPPLIHNGTGPGNLHGTEVAGIVFADGTVAPNVRGLLPDAQPILATFTQLTNRYQHTAELLEHPYEASFQTNSWGIAPSQPGYYNSTFELDDVLFQHDLLTFQAMANQGDNTAEQFAWAKNVLSVGGVLHQDTADLADDAWSNSGSIGPCEDGRIKPDVAYWFDWIRTIAGDSGTIIGFGGTSAATAQAAGYGGLMLQMWFEELLGNVHSGATVFEARPRAATARALVISGAVPYEFAGADADLSRDKQGWGRPNVSTLLADGERLFVVDESRVLSNLETAAYALEVEPGTPLLTATLAYLDPAGTTSSAQHRINDLSLRVTAPDGAAYWGNHGLLDDNLSESGGSSNTIDTVENVRLAAPAAGTWTVEVLADELVVDAHAETPALDAAFGLVVRGVQGAWEDLGGSYAVVGPAPILSGAGHLAGDDLFRLELTGAPAGAPTYFVIGGQNLSLPAYGGVVVPNPSLIVPATADAAGEARLVAEVPAGFAGEDFFFQAVTLDAAQAPSFVTLSNALRAVVR